MIGKLKKKLDQLLSSLEDRAGANPTEDITRLLAGMREELIDAKATIPQLEKQIQNLGKLREREIKRAADAERRGRQAKEIDDAETVEVAARFELKHLSRVQVYEQKIEAAEAELALQRRNVAEMTAQLKSALKNRDALAAQARRARATGNLRGGAASSVDEFDRMERQILDDEFEASAAQDIEDALSGLDGSDDSAFAPDPEDLADAQLEELKRRMAQSSDD
jgi:phage shock protein A